MKTFPPWFWLALGLVAGFAAGSAFGATLEWRDRVTLAWDANAETNLAGYRLYSGPASRVYDTIETISGGQTTATVSIAYRKTFFAVTAWTEDGLESDYSNEVATDPPPVVRVTLEEACDPAGPWDGLTNWIGWPTTPGRFYRAKLEITR